MDGTETDDIFWRQQDGSNQLEFLMVAHDALGKGIHVMTAYVLVTNILDSPSSTTSQITYSNTEWQIQRWYC